MKRMFTIAILTGCFGCSLQYGVAEPAGPATPAQPSTKPAAKADAESRQAFFGDLHVHTGFSIDAAMLSGTTITPEEAYRFGKGEPVTVVGKTIRISEPLDFMAVTDHAEHLGVGHDLLDPTTAAGKTPYATHFRNDDATLEELRSFFQKKQFAPGSDEASIGRTAWQREIDAAQKNYQPGKFTTFIAYEWSSSPVKGALHRNVIFRGDKVAYPFSALDSEKPEDLWTYLENNRKHGIEALDIPHNGNLSNGQMYDWADSDGHRIDRAYAERRMKNDVLNEIVQTKGQSETLPVLSPGDEFANFEIYDQFKGAKQKASGSYLREALGRGLVLSEETGANPFKGGFIGSSDIHNGLADPAAAGHYDLGNYSAAKKPDLEQAKVLIGEAPPKHLNQYGMLMASNSGLAGVWAEHNDRPSIYDAMRRHETFATSGTRMRVRFFGGWNYPDGLVSQPNWIHDAYAGGAPMGGDLPARPKDAKAPKLVVWAVKDPKGANLDRAQIIKVALDDKGEVREQVFDVALSDGRKVDPATGKAPAVGDTVDTKAATYQNSIGSVVLSAVWTDPAFDPAKPAVYYERVLEIPTPRWSTYVAAEYNLPLPKAPASIQQRGWSSPIWYTPASAK